jgi:hypothetical protein
VLVGETGWEAYTKRGQTGAETAVSVHRRKTKLPATPQESVHGGAAASRVAVAVSFPKNGRGPNVAGITRVSHGQPLTPR